MAGKRIGDVKFIAHRGATFAAPENTLPAFEAAARDRCAGAELDVRRTRDGVLVLSHNPDAAGTADGAPAKLRIAEHTFAELRGLCLGRDEKYGDIRIPTLREALELLRAPGLEAAIHCKRQDGEFLREVARTVVECGMSGRCAYNTENDFLRTIPAVSETDPAGTFHVPLAALTADPSIRSAVRPGAITATVSVAALTEEAAARVRREGFRLYVWNVRAEELGAALAAAPDYIEFVCGVRVKDLPAGE